jgi:hypothetical protein
VPLQRIEETMNRLISGVVDVFALATVTTAFSCAPLAHADVPPNCEAKPWGFLGTKTRIICDDPIRPDGSWNRERFIGIPRHYENASSHCSSSDYSSDCTYYPAGWVDTVTTSDDTYLVRADNVLPDEPGHMPDPAPGQPSPP